MASSNGSKQEQDLTGEADFAQAFKELTKGEQTAAALEKQLSSMEKKLDELLARAEQDQKVVERLAQAKASGDSTNSNEATKDT